MDPGGSGDWLGARILFKLTTNYQTCPKTPSLATGRKLSQWQVSLEGVHTADLSIQSSVCRIHQHHRQQSLAAASLTIRKNYCTYERTDTLDSCQSSVNRLDVTTVIVTVLL